MRRVFLSADQVAGFTFIIPCVLWICRIAVKWLLPYTGWITTFWVHIFYRHDIVNRTIKSFNFREVYHIFSLKFLIDTFFSCCIWHNTLLHPGYLHTNPANLHCARYIDQYVRMFRAPECTMTRWSYFPWWRQILQKHSWIQMWIPRKLRSPVTMTETYFWYVFHANPSITFWVIVPINQTNGNKNTKWIINLFHSLL